MREENWEIDNRYKTSSLRKRDWKGKLVGLGDV